MKIKGYRKTYLELSRTKVEIPIFDIYEVKGATFYLIRPVMDLDDEGKPVLNDKKWAIMEDRTGAIASVDYQRTTSFKTIKKAKETLMMRLEGYTEKGLQKLIKKFLNRDIKPFNLIRYVLFNEL